MNLKQIRESRGLTQKQVAEICKLSQAAIHKLESGKTKLVTNITSRLIKCLNLQVNGKGDGFTDGYPRLAEWIAEKVHEEALYTIGSSFWIEPDYGYNYENGQLHLDLEVYKEWGLDDEMCGLTVELHSVQFLPDEDMVDVHVSEERINEVLEDMFR